LERDAAARIQRKMAEKRNTKISKGFKRWNKGTTSSNNSLDNVPGYAWSLWSQLHSRHADDRIFTNCNQSIPFAKITQGTKCHLSLGTRKHSTTFILTTITSLTTTTTTAITITQQFTLAFFANHHLPSPHLPLHTKKSQTIHHVHQPSLPLCHHRMSQPTWNQLVIPTHRPSLWSNA
jgi:hypothetical protein